MASESSSPSTIRTFSTGATRDSEDNKLDFEGFLSPAALECFAEYMHAHRTQSDGALRDSDNWQKGIAEAAYMKSLWRHFFDFWKLHRGLAALDRKDGHAITQKEAACGILFNTMGYLHELLKKERAADGSSAESEGGSSEHSGSPEAISRDAQSAASPSRSWEHLEEDSLD